jgi:hypothetical protein
LQVLTLAVLPIKTVCCALAKEALKKKISNNCSDFDINSLFCDKFS